MIYITLNELKFITYNKLIPVNFHSVTLNDILKKNIWLLNEISF